MAETTGDPQTPGELIDPNSVALDEWGRAFVVDQKPSVIKVFDANGSYIRTIGGEGRAQASSGLDSWRCEAGMW